MNIKSAIVSMAALSISAITAAKPLFVGVSEALPAGGDPPRVAVNASYVGALAKAGHIPVVVSRFGTDGQFDALVARLDVLVMTGGEDLDPARYGEPASPKLGAVNAKRDSFDFRLLEAARRRRLPVVGICRGCQLLNVAFGGSLWQDLPSEFPARNIQHRNTRHAIDIDGASRLSKVLGTTNIIVNSTHHQAVKDLAPGFRIAAKSPKGVVEAIECDDYPALGVQFHPEKMAFDEDNEAFVRFFRDIGNLFK